MADGRREGLEHGAGDTVGRDDASRVGFCEGLRDGRIDGRQDASTAFASVR